MEEGEDRTQGATPARLQRAREEGQAPLSRELVSLVGLAAAASVLVLAGPGLARSLGGKLQRMLADPSAAVGQSLHEAGMAVLMAVVPLLVAVAAAAFGATLLQTGGLLHGKALAPDFARLDPRRGLSRIFGVSGLVEALKALAKAGVLCWAAWKAVADILPVAASAAAWQPGAMLDRMARDMAHVLLLVLGCHAAIAALDLGWTQFQFRRRLRMSSQDIKQEHKEAEGDPVFKARLKHIRLSRSRRRMMAKVAKATVVITNPTHYAVALAYDQGYQAAPRIVAKGVDEVAARIREAAGRANVPLVASPPLARALHALPLDAEVPAEHFKAVAEIIAYVWRLRGHIRNNAAPN